MITLVVGVLSMFEEASFDEVNRALRAAGLPEHREPRLDEAWEADLPSDQGLNQLREWAHDPDALACRGFYLPRDGFPPILTRELSVSSIDRLLGECVRLADRLELPTAMTADDLYTEPDELGMFELLAPAPGRPWQQFPEAALACVTLLEGCERSRRTRAALVFC